MAPEPEQLRGVVRWMLVRVRVHLSRYQAEPVGERGRARSREESTALLLADACAELGLEATWPLELAAERVWVWCGHRRIAGRTFQSALAVLPQLVVERAHADLAARAIGNPDDQLPPRRRRSHPAR